MIKRIVKWLFLVLLFIFISTNFLKIVSYIMKPNTIDLQNIAGLYGEEKDSLDMVYLGGSATFVYWEPLRAFENNGITSYNYAANTIQPELYKTMIKEVVKTQDPDVILIDARAFQYREKDQPPTEVAYRNVLTGMPLSLNKIEFIKENVFKTLQMDSLSYYFDIIKYHRDTKDVTINSQVEMAYGIYQHPYKGFYFVPKIEALKKENYMTKEKNKVAKETEEILIDLLEYLNTTKKKFLFVVSPYIEKKEHKENFNYIEEIITKYGYDFLDANDYDKKMGIDYKKDFYNYNHVNIFGADKYTDFIAKYLIENYRLPDRRKDVGYKDWYDLLPAWNEEVNETKKIINSKMGVKNEV